VLLGKEFRPSKSAMCVENLDKVMASLSQNTE
jgi:hypothetical protein